MRTFVALEAGRLAEAPTSSLPYCRGKCDQPRDEGTDVQGTVPSDPSKEPRLRVLIVDDDARVRRALRGLLECAPDLTVVGEARSTRSAKRLA